MILAATIAIILTREDPPEPGEEEAVLERERLALEAGALGHWVYPDTPGDEDTAYRHVLKLETDFEGALADLGKDKGHELRGKFFDSLVAQGDKWWEKEGGKSFAADFYSQAAVFAYDRDMEVVIPDEDSAKRAKDRSGMTRGAMSSFLRDAGESSFSEDEVYSASVVATLAEPDEEVREEKMKELTKKPGRRPLSATQLSRLTKLAKTDDLEDGPKADASASGGEPDTGGEEDDTGDETDGDEAPSTSDSGGKTSGGGATPTKTAKRDPSRSRKLSSEAASALASGQRKKAEGLFHQALAFDNRNAAALIGLSDIHFDRSNYQQAVQFASKVVQAAPKKANYRIRLGDAYFKLLRYQDSLREYQSAKKLGSKEASGRISKVQARLGK